MSSLPLGNISDLTGYSPADFGDAEDSRPLAIQLDPTGMGNLLPYSTLVQNVLSRHTHEIKEKSASSSSLPPNWRRKLREFLVTRNEDLVNSLKKSLDASHPLSKAQHFLVKFGRSDFQATHASLQTTFLDASGSSYGSVIDAELQEVGPSSSQQILDQVRWLFDQYKAAGEDCLREETTLKLKLDVFDKTYQKIVALYELSMDEDFNEVGESIEKYVRHLLEENRLEEQYTRTVEAYRKFAALRDRIQFFRFTQLIEREPLCSICMNDTVQFALTPCGHTFCGTCVKRQVYSCFMCRNSIKDRVKLYFG
jgi:hypothetical protein